MIEVVADSLRVSGPMVIANATALLQQGRQLLTQPSAGGVSAVDLASVAEVDSSALSVLFGWLRTARSAGIDLRVINSPASMLSLAALYGVADSLPLA